MEGKKLKYLLVSVMAVALIGCGAGANPEPVAEDTVIETDVNQNETNENNASEAEAVSDKLQQGSYAVTDFRNYSTKEPEVSDVSETEKQIYFYRDGLKIFGKLYLPEGDGKFPVVVMQPGFRGGQSQCGNMKNKFLENGIACLTYDCIGATDPSKSDGTIMDMTFLTEVADTNVVLDSIARLPKLDQDNVFVFGHSVGGLIVTYTATHRSGDVKGIIAAEPSYQMLDVFNDAFPKEEEIPKTINEPFFGARQLAIDAKALNPYEDMEKFTGEVIVFAGGKKPSIGAEAKEYLDRAIELFPNAELSVIEEADHVFSGESQQILIDRSVDFIKRNINAEATGE